MFEIRDLRFKHILDIPRLTLNHPISCIVGPSGSGKSTLLRHLNRLYVPDSGEIYYNGEPLSALDPVVLRRRVVLLGQTPVLYEGSVGDNLQIGLKFAQMLPASETALKAVLERVGLHKSLDGWCDRLSGGERQRLCLARVLLMDAETYLLDEPSAALDKETEDFVVSRLTQFVLEHGKNLVIVTHSEQISGCFPNDTLRMENGHVKGYGA